MKKNILLYMAAVAGLVLAGCNKTEVPEGDPLAMTVKASIGDLTKVAYDGASTTFETDDQIAVWGWTGVPNSLPQVFAVDGVVNTLKESGKWEPAKQMLWKNVKDEHYFIAVHPVPASAIANLSAVPYAVDNTNYEASDLLLATELTGLKAASKTVDLAFTHAMAKLQVNLKFRNQFGSEGPAPESVTAALEAKASAKVNYLTKVVTPIGTVAPVALAPMTAAATGYAMSFSGIQIPQNATKIVVTVGETTFSYTHPEPLPIEPGKVTTLGFNVGQNVILLESVTVTNWVEDDPLTGGEAELSAPGTKAADATAEDLGKLIGTDGKIYADAAAATAAGTTAVAKICYVGSETGEAAPYNHGLALALSDTDVNNGFSWNEPITDAGHTKQPSYPFTEESGLQYNDTHNSDAYPAFKSAITYSPAAPTGCSSWFLASAYQWQKMIDATGLSNLGLTGGGSYYWSSSESDDDHAWDFRCDEGIWYPSEKGYDDQVRACLAF